MNWRRGLIRSCLVLWLAYAGWGVMERWEPSAQLARTIAKDDAEFRGWEKALKADSVRMFQLEGLAVRRAGRSTGSTGTSEAPAPAEAGRTRPIAELGRLVKAKYPEYANIPDDRLGRLVKVKDPNAFSEFVDEPAAPAVPRTFIPDDPTPSADDLHALARAAARDIARSHSDHADFARIMAGGYRKDLRDLWLQWALRCILLPAVGLLATKWISSGFRKA